MLNETSQPFPIPRPRWPIAFGLVVGLVATATSLIIGGAGHGWIAPFWVSWSTFILAPLSAFSFARRHRPDRENIVLLLAGTLVVDVFLIVLSVREGTYGIRQVMRHAPLFLGFWAAAWLSWHSLVMAVIPGLRKVVQLNGREHS